MEIILIIFGFALGFIFQTIFNYFTSIKPYMKWLNDRIIQLKIEREKATLLDVKKNKGARLKAYKECLDYLRTHL